MLMIDNYIQKKRNFLGFFHLIVITFFSKNRNKNWFFNFFCDSEIKTPLGVNC